MDVRIGVTYSARELEVEVAASEAEAVKKQVDAVLGGKQDVLWLTDKRGRSVAVSAQKIAYVEVGAESGDRRIGFIG